MAIATSPACVSISIGETERITLAFRWQDTNTGRYAGLLDGATETISTVQVAEVDTSALTLSGAAYNASGYTEQDTQYVVAAAQAATWLVAGAVAGEEGCYIVRVTVTTSAGRTLIRDVKVCVED